MQRVVFRGIAVTAFAFLALLCAPSAPPQLAAAAAPLPGDVEVGVGVNLGFFYDKLAPEGHWIQTPKYGWSWHPNGVAVDWRPYTVGSWDYSDDYGWLWQTDEPWGWATYHYGRWYWDDVNGWMWVPGSDWAPAWVAWRSGGGYVGWCALPPEVTWSAEFGLDWGGFSFGVDFDHPRWCFVHDRDFGDRHLHDHLVVAGRNRTLFDRTADATHYGFEKDRIENRGLKVDDVQHFTGHEVNRVKVQNYDSLEALHSAKNENGEVGVYRAKIAPGDGGHQPPHIDSERDKLGPEELQQRQQEEAKGLIDRQAAEQRALEEEHRQEIEHRPAGIEPEELQRQHELERRTLESQHQHMREFQQQTHARELGARGGRGEPGRRGGGGGSRPHR